MESLPCVIALGDGEQAHELALVEHAGERLALLRRAQHEGGVAVDLLVLLQEAEEALERGDGACLAGRRRPAQRLLGEEAAQVYGPHLAYRDESLPFEECDARAHVALAESAARAVAERAYSPGVTSVTLASGLKLSYARQGDAVQPVVLLLPGPTDSWRSYQPVLDHLPRETHAISVSQRGHGESAKPDSGYGVEDFAADVVLLLDALGIARAVLAGHSGSCLVARRVALDQPDRVAGLFLEASPTTLRDDPQLVGSLESVMSKLEDPITAGFARSFLTHTSSVGIPRDLIDLLVEELLKVPTHVWRETFSGLLEYDDLSELGRIEAPTLLVWGDADAVVPREMQDRLARSIPDADLLVYHGVGHTPRWEDPMRFSSDLASFARQVAPTKV